jgi:hypothetical protein
VIERRCRPIGGGMTDRAVRWKSRRNMIRHRAPKSRRALPGCQMAAIAGRRIQRVIVVHMAGRARSRRRRNVHSGQRETGDTVIERRRCPPCGRMASGAVRRGKCRS